MPFKKDESGNYYHEVDPTSLYDVTGDLHELFKYKLCRNSGYLGRGSKNPLRKYAEKIFSLVDRHGEQLASLRIYYTENLFMRDAKVKSFILKTPTERLTFNDYESVKEKIIELMRDAKKNDKRKKAK